MQFHVVFGLALLLTVAQQAHGHPNYTIENVLAKHVGCALEGQVPLSRIIRFMHLEFPNEAKVRCYLKCMMQSLELFDGEHVFNKDNMYIAIEQTKEVNRDSAMYKKIANCVDNHSNGSDGCTRAYQVAICLVKLKKIEQIVVA